MPPLIIPGGYNVIYCREWCLSWLFLLQNDLPCPPHTLFILEWCLSGIFFQQNDLLLRPAIMLDKPITTLIGLQLYQHYNLLLMSTMVFFISNSLHKRPSSYKNMGGFWAIFMNIQLQRDIFYTFRTFRSITYTHGIAIGRSYPTGVMWVQRTHEC
jgi:hypothetical protein